MKVNYYRRLLRWDGKLTPTDRIVYDFLLTKSISVCCEIFETDGSGINIEALVEYLKDSGNRLDIYSISYRKLAKELGISLASTYNSLTKLKSLLLIGDDWIDCNPDIPRGGYFEVRMDLLNEISGKLLIFYSWLCDRAKNGVVDAHRKIMAKYFNDKETNIHNMLQRLHSMGFVERESDSMGNYGKLKLLK